MVERRAHDKHIDRLVRRHFDSQNSLHAAATVKCLRHAAGEVDRASHHCGLCIIQRHWLLFFPKNGETTTINGHNADYWLRRALGRYLRPDQMRHDSISRHANNDDGDSTVSSQCKPITLSSNKPTTAAEVRSLKRSPNTNFFSSANIESYITINGPRGPVCSKTTRLTVFIVVITCTTAYQVVSHLVLSERLMRSRQAA